MPKIEHFQRSRNINIELAPKKLRLKMLRNQIKFVISPVENDSKPVGDLFDELDTSVHEHATGLFYLMTTFQHPDDSYVDKDRFLQVVINFEKFEDMERVQKNVLLPLKLSL